MTLTQPQIPPAPQATDISQRAIRLGRILDRMARGKYIILVDVGASDWTASVLSESTLTKIATVLDENYRLKIYPDKSTE